MVKDFFEHVGGFFAKLISQPETWVFLIVFGLALPLVDPRQIPAFLAIFFAATWWFWPFLALAEICRELFLHVRQQKFRATDGAPGKYVLFEIRIPRELEKSAKSMEHVFQSLHGMADLPGNWREKYLEGKVPLWFSLEFVSLGGELHIYLRMLRKNANLTETAFFSQYPDVEIVEVNDYMRDLPGTTAELYALGMDMWGTEFILAKEGAFPIKTYQMFETGSAEKQIDPISAFLETLAKLKRGETAIIQILIFPADKDWAKAYEELVKKLRTPEMVDVGGGVKAPVPLTAKKAEVVNAVETKLTKPAFKTLVRLVYMSPGLSLKEGSAFARGGIMGAFNQYSAPNMNAFKANAGITTKIDKWKFPYSFIDRRLEYRKQRLLNAVRERVAPPDSFMAKLFSSYFFEWNFDCVSYELTTEELATIYHPAPTGVLTAPHMRRLESKKAGPLAGLDIFGEEEELEKFTRKTK